MKTSVWAKILGWSQFGLQALAQVGQAMQSNGTPHGVFSWIGFGASLATAVAIHGASSTDGGNPEQPK